MTEAMKIGADSAQNLPAMRATVEEVVARGNRVVALFEEAWRAISAAQAKVDAARLEWAELQTKTRFYGDSQTEEVKRFSQAVDCPDRAEYARTARRLVDSDVWAWVIEHTDLERLMDKEAKDKLREQMRYVPARVDRRGQVINQDEIDKGLPPATVENITATLEGFMDNAGMIFRRGIANAFSKLDRRFRSHDGFKVGSRVILSHAFDENGRWSYHNHHRDTLMDIERTFSILDGKDVKHNYASTIGAIDAERNGTFHPTYSEVEVEYFRVRIFKNGNAHLWMLRKDLVRKVNLLLAEHYGEVIADANEAYDDPLENRALTPAKRFGFFPTPDNAAERLMARVPVLRKKGDERLRILEPSAGTGNLAFRCLSSPKLSDQCDYDWQRDQVREFNKSFRFDNIVDCVEVQANLVSGLRLRVGPRGLNKVVCADFLSLPPEPIYDLVVMNPPFDRERDVDHVTQALKWLKPDGQLHAIMSAGTEWRDTRKSSAFRKLVIDEMGGSFEELPAGSFAESGTNVNTVMLRVRADRKPWSRW